MIETETKDGYTLVRLTETRLDAQRAPAFKSALAPLLAAQPDKVVLDASGVEFVDSTGLGSLVSLLKMMGATGELAIAGPRPAVRKLFTVTRLDRVMRLYDSVDDAADALRR
jgi:anti-sigma B factor antagonist